MANAVPAPPLPGNRPNYAKRERTSEALKGPDLRMSYPQSSVGGVVNFVAGRKRIVPTVIDVSTARAIYRTETETSTREEVVQGEPLILGGVTYPGKKETIIVETTVSTTFVDGYLLDIQLALCLGPDVRILGVYSDDVVLWEGNAGPARTILEFEENETAYSKINAIFSGGSFTQSVDPVYVDRPDYADLPGYVGVAYLILPNIRADMALGNMTVEVSRYPDPLELGSDNREGDDINAGSLLAEVLTNDWGAGGFDISILDDVSFQASAARLADEKNAGSILISEEMPIANVVSALQDQMNSVIVQNPVTRLVECRLIRQESINLAALPKFGPRNIDQMQSFTKSGWPSTIDRLQGSFLNRLKTYQETPVYAVSTSQTGNSRSKKTMTTSYPYVHSEALGMSLAARDIGQLGEPVFFSTIVVKRDGSSLLPGDVIALAWPRGDLVSTPAQVLRVKRMPIPDNTVIVESMQIVIPDPSVILAPPAPPYDTDIDFSPVTPLSVDFMTAPYWIVRARAGISTDVANAGVHPMILPVAGNDLQISFRGYIENLPGSSDPVIALDNSLFPIVGILADPIDRYDSLADGVIGSIRLTDVVNSAAFLNFGESGVRSGRGFLMIGNEIFSFESAAPVSLGEWELSVAHRALLDTAPTSHSAGAKAHAVGNNYGFVPTTGFALPMAYTPNWLIVSRTLNGLDSIDDALESNDWSETQNRTLAPLRPHDLHIENVRDTLPIPVTRGGTVNLQWRTRSRASLVVALTTDDPEPGEIIGSSYQVHRPVVIDSGNVVWEFVSSTPDDAFYNDYSFAVPSGMALGLGELYLRSETARGSSLFHERLPIEVIEGELRITESGDLRVTEDNQYRITEN